MNYENALLSLVKGIKGQIIVLDAEGNQVSDEKSILSNDTQIKKIHSVSSKLLSEENYIEWEFYDKDAENSYKVNSVKCEENNTILYVHQLIDVTDYVGLNREMGQYSQFYREMSDFYNSMMDTLGQDYYKILSIYASLYHANNAYFFWNMSDKAASIVSFIDGKYSTKNLKEYDIEEINTWSSYKKGYINEEKTKYCCFAGDAFSHKYAVIVDLDADSIIPDDRYSNIANAYLENSTMKAQVLYDSEHDSMTGLFNKSKYLNMTRDVYPNLDSIAIFNFDVNNLKKMNDTYGHEMGDKLLIKAAESISAVTEENVHGYRIGGDEYLMIACNVTREKVDEIKRNWEEALAKLNTRDDGIDCIIAVGVAYAEKEYDYHSLVRHSDKLMYEDKKSKKKPGEEIR